MVSPECTKMPAETVEAKESWSLTADMTVSSSARSGAAALPPPPALVLLIAAVSGADIFGGC